VGFIDRLPASMTDPAYAALVMEYIESGNIPIAWSTITSDYNGHHAEFYVPTDALMIEGVRIDVSAHLGQQICDLLGCLMLTPKLAELMWYQRQVTLNPVTLVHTPADTQFMATTAWMLKHSRAIDAQLAAQGNPSGLRCTVGKVWVIGKVLEAHPGLAINFGWQNATTGPMCVTPPPPPPAPPQPRCHVIQDPGWYHPPSHIDYSQIFLGVRRDCLVDGQRRDIADVLRDPALAGLASYDGPLKLFRQPGVPIIACKIGLSGPDDLCPMPPVRPPETTSTRKTALVVGAVAVGAIAAGTVWWLRR